MLKILICVLFPIVYAWTSTGPMIGPGIWTVRNMAQCPDHEQYSIDLNVKKRMLNRTHDCFEGYMKPKHPVDNTYGILIDVCKKCDGGCKDYMVMEYDCFCCYVKENIQDNFVKALTAAGVDPPDCPIAEGEYEIKNFVFDYTELRKNGPYGEYIATSYLTKGKDENMEKVACVVVHLEFDKDDD